MLPQLALIICTIFVLFLLRLERKLTPDVSHVLWIPTIWMISIASKPIAVWLGSEGLTHESGSPLDRAFLSVLLCLGLFILIQRRFNWSSAIKENAWLMLLIGFMLISILWSDIQFISFKRWIRQLIAVIMAFIVLSEPAPRQAMESLLRRTTYILIPFSLLLIKYFPEYGRQYDSWSGQLTWIGITVHKNGLGRLCLIATVFLIWTLLRRWQGRGLPVKKYHTYVDVFILIMALLLLKGPAGAYPATAFVTLVLTLLIFVGLLWMKKHRRYVGANTLMAIFALCIVFGIAVPFYSGLGLEVIATAVGRDASLTGRTDIWSALIPFAVQRLILGWGFGGFWTYNTLEEYPVNEAHNGFLEVVLILGLVGLLLVSIFLLSFCRKIQRELSRDFDWASLCICFLVMTLFHNITESTIHMFATHLTAVLIFLAVSTTAVTSHSPKVSREVGHLET